MTEQEIAALKAGDELTFKVEKVVWSPQSGGVFVTFQGANCLGDTGFLAPSVLAHATLTPAPEPPLAVGEPVMCDGLRWEVAAPPRTRDNGGEEVSLWRGDYGYRYARLPQCTRVQP